MPPSKRNELVDTAMRVFYTHGFHGTGIDQVLKEGNISRMTLYNHFKSKDELILAALERRDEIFRSQLSKYLDENASTPIQRILAFFDYYSQWFSQKNFCGCMFINASAEFSQPDSSVHHLAAVHKAEVLRLLRLEIEAAHLLNPTSLAEQLGIILEGAIVTAQILGRDQLNPTTSNHIATQAKQIASQILTHADKSNDT